MNGSVRISDLDFLIINLCPVRVRLALTICAPIERSTLAQPNTGQKYKRNTSNRTEHEREPPTPIPLRPSHSSLVTATVGRLHRR